MIAPVVDVEAIHADWMSQTLRAAGVLSPSARVVEIEREPCGTGQLADSYRFVLRYDTADAGPPSIVGKFASEDATSRAFGRDSGYYRNEIRFYQDLAPQLSLAIPAPIHAALADDETAFVLLMEDLTPARVVDQIAGCTADQAALALEQAAALHAGSWHDRDLAGTDWLGGTGRSFVQVTDGFPALVASYPETYGDLIPEHDLAEAARLNDHLDAWKRVFTEPQCLWHSDLRVDNLLFGARGGALPVALLDWQGVGFARGTIDVAYFLGTSLTIEHRREHERSLVAHYHDALTAAGVCDYDAETCWEDYRMLAVHGLQTGVFGLGAVRRSERGDELWRVWIERTAAQTRDLDSFTALAKR